MFAMSWLCYIQLVYMIRYFRFTTSTSGYFWIIRIFISMNNVWVGLCVNNIFTILWTVFEIKSEEYFNHQYSLNTPIFTWFQIKLMLRHFSPICNGMTVRRTFNSVRSWNNYFFLLKFSSEKVYQRIFKCITPHKNSY